MYGAICFCTHVRIRTIHSCSVPISSCLPWRKNNAVNRNANFQLLFFKERYLFFSNIVRVRCYLSTTLINVHTENCFKMNASQPCGLSGRARRTEGVATLDRLRLKDTPICKMHRVKERPFAFNLVPSSVDKGTGRQSLPAGPVGARQCSAPPSTRLAPHLVLPTSTQPRPGHVATGVSSDAG